MKEYKRLWMILGLIMVGSFILLGYFGKEIYNERPPIPAEFVDESGKTIYTEADILAGQSAWQSIGGMSVGTVWGHGAYQAPDWTADWIHREVLGWLDQQAQREFGKPYDQLSERDQATLHYDAQQAFRKNTYDQATGKVTLSADRVRSIEGVAAYYDKLFGSDPELHKLREAYAMKEDTLPDADKRAKLNAFFFWSAWAASTNRPNLDVTYTNNWPHEPLIGNHPSAENVIWSISSVVTLIFGIGSVIWIWAFFTRHEHDEIVIPERDPLTLVKLTPSQKALWKYLLVVAALFFTQVMLGGFTAHYTVEGQDFYGIPVADWLPYSLTRTWHIQSAIFWIATGFLAAGLFLVPIINGGKDPKFQKLGVRRAQRLDERQTQLLARPPRLRIRGNRPPVANCAVPRPRLLAGPHAARHLDGTAPAGRQEPARPLYRLRCRHRPALRTGAGIRRTHPYLHHGILALVGRAPLGRRLL